MILLSTTMGVFVILTIFAFYLARFSITENRSSSYYLFDIKARSLALSGLNHSLELFKVNRDISNTSGRINKGDYTIYKVASVDELGESLNRTHYFTFKSIATIDDVKRKIRCQVSSMPEAFSLVFYGNNAGSVDLNNTVGTITGDIFYNGNIISNGGSYSGVNYTSTGVGGTAISNQPPFPEFDDSLFENLLVTVLSNNNSNKALDLDVASISIDDHNDINLETHATRTIELWFKVDNKSLGSKQVLYEEGGSTRGLNIYISEDGLLYVGGWNRKESESKWMGNWISATIENNQWHHVALTLGGEVDGSISSDALKMYLDGNFINSSEVLPFFKYVLPLMGIFVVVVGSIIGGIATPTESAALGALATLIAATAYKKLSWSNFTVSINQTLRFTVMTLFIICGSITFSQILAFSEATAGLSSLVVDSDLRPIAVLIGMLLILMFLGCFMDQVSMMMITIPIFMPLVEQLGFNVIWFGVLMLLVLEISLATPPFGLLLFVVKGAAPDDTTMEQIIFSVLPFIGLALILAVLLILIPEITLILPNLITR